MVAGGDRDGAEAAEAAAASASTSRWSTTARRWTPRWTTRWWPRSRPRTSTSSGEPAVYGGVPGRHRRHDPHPRRAACRPWSTARAASGSPTRPTSSSRSPTSSRCAQVYAEAARRFLDPRTPHDRRALAPGRPTALTDVAGIRVGHATRRGDGWLYRHDGRAGRDRRRRRRRGRARRRPGHPGDRPARPAQRRRARPRGGAHRRQRVRPGRGRRGDGRAGRPTASASRWAGRARSCRSCPAR